MVDKEADENETMELKENNDHYLEERKKIIEITQLKIEEMFRDFLKKRFHQKKQLSLTFFNQNDLKNMFLNINIFKPKRKVILIFILMLLLSFQFF